MWVKRKRLCSFKVDNYEFPASNNYNYKAALTKQKTTIMIKTLSITFLPFSKFLELLVGWKAPLISYKYILSGNQSSDQRIDLLQCNCREPEQNKLNQMNFTKDEDVNGKAIFSYPISQ